MFNASAQRTAPGREREMNGAGKAAHLPIDGKAGRKPAPSVMNERSRFVAQASSLQPMQPEMAALPSESPTIEIYTVRPSPERIPLRRPGACLFFLGSWFGPWRSLVAHLHGVQGVVSSSLTGPTT